MSLSELDFWVPFFVEEVTYNVVFGNGDAYEACMELTKFGSPFEVDNTEIRELIEEGELQDEGRRPLAVLIINRRQTYPSLTL